MRTILLLGLTSLLTDVASEMVYPLLPLFLVSSLGASPAVLGFIEGVAESLASLMKLCAGYFSDRMKRRRPFAIFGYGCSALGKLILYAATGWTAVLAGRIVDRFGKGVRVAPRDALIAEAADAGRRGAAFGLHRALDTLGATIGVGCAYLLLAHFKQGLRPIFLASLVPAALGVGILFFVKEKTQGPAVLRAKPVFGWRALDTRLRLFLIGTFLFTLGNSSNQFLLLRAKGYGFDFSRVLLLYLFYNVVYGLCSYPAAWLSDRIGRRRLLVTGYLVYGLVYVGFARADSAGWFWWLFGLYGVYMGCTEGVEKALIADISPQESRATMLGTHAMLVGIGLLPASFLAGLLWNYFGPAAPFYCGGFFGLAASVWFWLALSGTPAKAADA